MYLLTCFYLLIYAHLNSVFELLSKSVVESKQKINILKLSTEEDEEKKEFEEAKRGEGRGTGLAMSFFFFCLSFQFQFRGVLKTFLINGITT